MKVTTHATKSRDQVQVQTKRKINSSRRYQEKEELSLQMIIGGADYHVENDKQTTARNITAPFPT